MVKAEQILFEQLYGNSPLFLSQQDLANQLLSNQESEYYTPINSSSYQNSVNRLKTFISQLLSDNVSRNLTPVFRKSLEKLIEVRLKNSGYDVKEVTNAIFRSLADRNKPSSARKFFTSPFNPKRELIEDITNASYVLVITARPFDISDSDTKFSLQQSLIQDLFLTLTSVSTMKYYRFNFPLRTLCELFWLALRKALEKTLSQHLLSKEFIQNLFSKNYITSSTFNRLYSQSEISNNDIAMVTNELINYLTTNRYILVFLVNAPIFSVPMVITNPNDSKNSRAYVVLENESKFTHVNKLPAEDILAWKYFVFDRIKTQGLGEQIDYMPSIHRVNQK